MGILLSFAPFIVFAAFDRLIGATEGLFAAAIMSAFILARDWVSASRSPKILETGTLILFGGLALYSFIANSTWSIVGVRLRVDLGLLLIVLMTIIIRRPFTLQYACEQVSKEHWATSEFVRTNYVVTAAWALAFTVLVVADLVLLYMPELPPRFGVVATILALVGAVKFTGWYPARNSIATLTRT
jgi:hypothetical protein